MGQGMRVKIHPHRNKVMQGIEECISVTHDKKGGRAYYAGTVILSDVEFRIHNSGVARAQKEGVRNVHAWAVGELVDQHACQNPITARFRKQYGLRKVTYHFEEGYFQDHKTGAVITKTALLYAVGRDFYYLPECD
jgi:hypothetical protein